MFGCTLAFSRTMDRFSKVKFATMSGWARVSSVNREDTSRVLRD
jgi:hypothetical protein